MGGGGKGASEGGDGGGFPCGDELFIGNLDKSGALSEDVISDYFASYGEVDQVTIKVDRDGIPRGFGFVKFKAVESAEAVMANKASIFINGAWIDCKPAEQRAPASKGGEGKGADGGQWTGKGKYGGKYGNLVERFGKGFLQKGGSSLYTGPGVVYPGQGGKATYPVYPDMSGGAMYGQMPPGPQGYYQAADGQYYPAQPPVQYGYAQPAAQKGVYVPPGQGQGMPQQEQYAAYQQMPPQQPVEYAYGQPTAAAPFATAVPAPRDAGSRARYQPY